LPQGFHVKKENSKILSPKLQNEGSNKKVVRLCRRFCKQTFNLEVEETHCFLANGVIAHNCIDAIRYGFEGIEEDDSDLTRERHRQFLNDYYQN
jgi:hypothetical protein